MAVVDPRPEGWVRHELGDFLRAAAGDGGLGSPLQAHFNAASREGTSMTENPPKYSLWPGGAAPPLNTQTTALIRHWRRPEPSGRHSGAACAPLPCRQREAELIKTWAIARPPDSSPRTVPAQGAFRRSRPPADLKVGSRCYCTGHWLPRPKANQPAGGRLHRAGHTETE